MLRHPTASLLVSGLVVAALAVPALGMKMDEATLLRTAAAYEQLTDWHEQSPANR